MSPDDLPDVGALLHGRDVCWPTAAELCWPNRAAPVLRTWFLAEALEQSCRPRVG